MTGTYRGNGVSCRAKNVRTGRSTSVLSLLPLLALILCACFFFTSFLIMASGSVKASSRLSALEKETQNLNNRINKAEFEIERELSPRVLSIHARELGMTEPQTAGR